MGSAEPSSGGTAVVPLVETAAANVGAAGGPRADGLVVLQAHVRGRIARSFTRQVLSPARTSLSRTAINVSIKQLLELHDGFNHFVMNSSMLLVIIFISWLQLMAETPQAAWMMQSINTKAQGIATGSGMDAYSVFSPAEVMDYGTAIINAFYSTDPYVPLKCPVEFSLSDPKLPNCSKILHNATYVEQCASQTAYSGYINSYTRLQTFLIVRQQRYVMVDCDKSFNNETGAETSAKKCPSPSGELATKYSSVYLSQNPNVLAAGMSPLADNVSAAFLPSFGGANNYFDAIIDLGLLNLPKASSLCAWRYLQDAMWIDRETALVQYYVVTHNSEGAGTFMALDVSFAINQAGQVWPNIVVYGASLINRNTHVPILFFSGLFCFYSLWSLIFKFFRPFAAQFGMFGAKQTRYARTWGLARWLLEFFVYAMQLACCITFFVKFSYLNQLEAINISTRTFITALTDLYNVFFVVRVLQALYAYLLLGMCFRTIVSFDFHEDIALVTDTVRLGGPELASWFFVYFAIVCIYSYIGTLLFAANNSSFSSFGVSMSSMLYMSIMMFVEPTTLGGGAGFTMQLFVWSFIAIMTMLMFNVLLAIIWDAYYLIKENKRATHALPFTMAFRIYLTTVAYDWKNYYWPRLTCAKTTQHADVPRTKSSSFFLFKSDQFVDGLNELLKKPHRAGDRLDYIRRNCESVVLVAAMRAELMQLYKQEDIMLKLAAVMHFRTVIFRPEPLRDIAVPYIAIDEEHYLRDRLHNVERMLRRLTRAERGAGSISKPDRNPAGSM